ncbi:MAG: EpsG family protein [Lachnospiraceae bacterium]
MLFYAIVIAITTLLAWLYSHISGRRIKKIVFLLSVLVPSAISGLRGVGSDYWIYIRNCDEIIEGVFENVDYNSLFTQITRFLFRFDVDFQVIIFITSLVTICAVFRTINLYKKNISYTFGVFSYMLIFFQMSFNTYRQILAACLFLVATVFLYRENNKKKFGVWYIAAVLIHSSILPFGLVYFFKDKILEDRYKKKRILLYCITAIVIFIIPSLTSQMSFLLKMIPHYGWYITRFYRTGIGIGILRYLVMGVVPIVFIVRKKVYKEMQEIGLGFIPFYISMGFVLWLTSYISESSIYRISYNMLIAFPLLHGYIFKKYLRKSRIIVCISVIVIMLGFWAYDGIMLNTGETVPYQFYWQVR